MAAIGSMPSDSGSPRIRIPDSGFRSHMRVVVRRICPCSRRGQIPLASKIAFAALGEAIRDDSNRRCRCSRIVLRCSDVGCGRGEFLRSARGGQIEARGINLNHEMARRAAPRGLNVTEADAVDISQRSKRLVGGIFSAQVVEHLEPGYLLQLLELSFQSSPRRTLRARNVESCVLGCVLRQLHSRHHARLAAPSQTLKYLAVASGFSSASVEFRSPVREQINFRPFATS